jgi:hypothetical protein
MMGRHGKYLLQHAQAGKTKVTQLGGRADIFVGALHEPPQLSDFGFARLGVLEQVFAVALITRRLRGSGS